MPPIKIPSTVKGRYGKLTLLPRRHRYPPGEDIYGHAYPGFPMIYYNRNSTPAVAARTVVHEAMHAWEPCWWKEYGGADGPPEWMVRKLESCIWDLLLAFLERNTEPVKHRKERY